MHKYSSNYFQIIFQGIKKGCLKRQPVKTQYEKTIKKILAQRGKSNTVLWLLRHLGRCEHLCFLLYRKRRVQIVTAIYTHPYQRLGFCKCWCFAAWCRIVYCFCKVMVRSCIYQVHFPLALFVRPK